MTSEQYEAMMGQYGRALAEVAAQIAGLRVALSERLGQAQTALETHRQERNNLEIQFKVGEIGLKAYERKKRRLDWQILSAEERLSAMQRLLDAKTSAEVAERLREAGKSRAAALHATGFPWLLLSLSELPASKARMAGLVGGGALLVSLFLKWISVPEIESFPLRELSEAGQWLFGVGIAAGSASVLASVLLRSRSGGLVHIVAGACLAGVFVWAWFGGYLVHGDIEDVIGRAVWELITVREGLYLYLASTVLLVASGFLRLAMRQPK